MAELTVPASADGVRPDRFLRRVFPELERASALQLLKSGRLVVNGQVASLRTVLRAGDVLSAPLDKRSVVASDGPAPAAFGVVYRDADLVVVEKPSGLATHPAVGIAAGESLVEHVRAWLDAQGQSARVAAAGRLDRGTSGLVVMTLSEDAERTLGPLFQSQEVHKEYLALCHGVPDDRFTVAAPIPVGKPGRGRVMKDARTEFERISTGNSASLVRAIPQTGRTHQIRRHLAASGHPIVGDDRYGHRDGVRLCLHAARLVFAVRGRTMDLVSALPADFRAIAAARGIGVEMVAPRRAL